MSRTELRGQKRAPDEPLYSERLLPAPTMSSFLGPGTALLSSSSPAALDPLPESLSLYPLEQLEAARSAVQIMSDTAERGANTLFLVKDALAAIIVIVDIHQVRHFHSLPHVPVL